MKIKIKCANKYAIKNKYNIFNLSSSLPPVCQQIKKNCAILPPSIALSVCLSVRLLPYLLRNVV